MHAVQLLIPDAFFNYYSDNFCLSLILRQNFNVAISGLFVVYFNSLFSSQETNFVVLIRSKSKLISFYLTETRFPILEIISL